MTGPRPAERAHWLEPTGAWLAFAVPLLVGLLRCQSTSEWQGDLAVVRAIGLVPVGGEGVVTSMLAQAMVLVPLGGRWLRIAALGAIAAGIAGLALYELTRRLLSANAASPALGAALSLASAVMVALAPAWQHELAAPGGGSVAGALGLGAVALAATGTAADARRWCGVGALLALAAFESRWTGAVAALAIGGSVFVGRSVPPPRVVAAGAVGLGAGTLLAIGPVVARALSPHTWMDLGLGLGLGTVLPGGIGDQSSLAAAAWQRELGPVPLALALLGALWGLARGKTRAWVVPLVLLAAADELAPLRAAGAGADPRAPLRLLALGAVAVAAALGVQTLVLGLQRVRVPFARPAAVLLVVFELTFALVATEDAAYAAASTEARATEVFTDEALAGLPPRAVLLVRSEPVLWRLWAASLVRGERPDLVIVPMAFLERGIAARRLLASAPELGAVVRDIAVQGRPGEYALASLADARPLYVEVDPAWDPRLLAHLQPGAMWFRFVPHGLGRSDRTLGVKVGAEVFTRALAAAGAPATEASHTRAAVIRRLREQAAVLVAMGDHELAGKLLAVAALDGSATHGGADPADPADPIARAVAERLAGRRPAVDIATWLSY